MGRYLPGDIDETLNLSNLGARTLISTQFDNVVNERTFVSSIEAIWTLAEFTPLAQDGPILVGVAHSDYTDAEIQAVIDATASWNEGDLIAQEVSHRKVRKIGIFPSPSAAQSTESVVLNDGRKIKTKLNWILLQSQTLRVWAFNMGSSVLTTGAHVDVQGKANLWPR